MYFPNNDMNNEDRRPEEMPVHPGNGYTEPVQTNPAGEEPVDRSAPAPKAKKKNTGMKIVAACLCCTLLGGAAGVGGAALYTSMNVPEATPPAASNQTTIYEGTQLPSVVNVVNLPSRQELSPAEVYASNVGACVGITVSTTTNIFGYTTTSAATGSGFVISSDGYIVTNYHVVKRATQSAGVPISVSFQNGETYDAKYVGGEEENDVAVLKIEASGLTPVVLGDSEKLVVGEPVYAIGNPLGELTYSLTDGLVSALDRVITAGSSDEAVSMNMLQTNCAINSGNSGGPLFNRFGEVIGITSAKMSGSSSSTATIEGLGFAIPINDVKGIIRDLIEYGYVTGKPYMGITSVTVTQADAQRYNLSVGAYVESVEAGSSAEKAGLQVGDVITAIDETEITTYPALAAAKAMYRAGDTVTLRVVRDKQEIELQLTFDEEKPASQTTQGADQNGQNQQGGSQNPQGGQNSQNGQNGQNGQSGGSDYSSLFPWYAFPFGSIFG